MICRVMSATSIKYASRCEAESNSGLKKNQHISTADRDSSYTEISIGNQVVFYLYIPYIWGLEIRKSESSSTS